MGFKKVQLRKISADGELEYVADCTLKKVSQELTKKMAVGLASRYCDLAVGEGVLVEAAYRGFLITREDLSKDL